MGEFVKVATIKDFDDGQAKVVEAKGKKIALYKVDGEFFATANECLHQQGPLGEGEIENGVVTCPWHQWKFDVKTGENQFDKSMKLKTFKTKVDGENVLIEV